MREEADGSRKYSLGNPPAATAWERLAFMQAQRFWIERSFQDAKSELGLADYELRGWTGWHHHVALVCLAQLFTLIERRLAKRSRPLLSVRDITELLEIYLPRRPRTEQAVLRKIARRHRARENDIHRRLIPFLFQIYNNHGSMAVPRRHFLCDQPRSFRPERPSGCSIC